MWIEKVWLPLMGKTGTKSKHRPVEEQQCQGQDVDAAKNDAGQEGNVA